MVQLIAGAHICLLMIRVLLTISCFQTRPPTQASILLQWISNDLIGLSANNLLDKSVMARLFRTTLSV